MKNSIIKITIITIYVISLFFVIPAKTSAAVFSYPDEVVENLGSVIASEIGCADSKDHFIYELIWAGVFVNNYNFWIEKSKTPSTVVFTTQNMCTMFGLGKVYSPAYCYYTYAKRAANRGGDCTAAQKYQTNLAAKMVLAKSFNIPRNITYAAEGSVANTSNNVVWAHFQPTVNGKAVGLHTYFSTDAKKPVATKDVYGNTISNDLEFYKKLATCLYNNPTLYGAYNKCSDSTTPTPTDKYIVYLYPNGGYGIYDGFPFEYTTTTSFDDFPLVTREKCDLDGWNIDSPNGTEYYSDVRASDNGKKLYARWTCRTTPIPVPDPDPDPEPEDPTPEITKYTVTFKLNDGTSKTYWSDVVKANNKVNKPENDPTRSGYTFEGWTNKSGEEFNFDTKITKDLTLYAKWSKISKPSSSNSSKSSSSSSSQSSEKPYNPETGTFGIMVFAILMIPTSLAIFYYYKNNVNKI